MLHGNREDPGKQVHISCRCGPGKEVSIIIEDEGQGFDTTAVLYPAVLESPKSHNQRGIQLMRMCMDEVHFEHGGREVHMRKRLPSVSNPHLVSYGGLQRALAMLSLYRCEGISPTKEESIIFRNVRVSPDTASFMRNY